MPMQRTVARLLTTVSVAVLLAAVPPVSAQTPSPVQSSPSTDSRSSVAACISSGPVVPGPGQSFPPAAVRPAPSARPVGAWDGTWRRMTAAPIAGRMGAATDTAVWDDRLYVWGGRDAAGKLLDDGAVYDLRKHRWTKLPPSGLVARERFGFDSDNQGITIWGGIDAQGRPLGDGARLLTYPRADHWVELPAAPLTPGPASLSGDVNATFAVTPGAHAGDPPVLAVLDEDDDTLRWDDPSSPDRRRHGDFPAPPVPPGIAYEVASARDELLLLSYQADGTAVASWFTGYWLGEWSDPVSVGLPVSAGCPAVDLPTMAWLRADGGSMVALSTVGAEQGWRTMAPPPADVTPGGMMVWAPRYLVVADALVAYDTVDETWLRLPPLPDGPRTGVSAGWDHGRLYVWGGRTADGRVTDTGWIFTPTLPKGTYRLPGGFRDGYGDCGGVGIDGHPILRMEEHAKPRVWVELGGRRYPAGWPDGFVVRFGDGRAEIIGPDGKVVARDGDDIDTIGLGYCPTGTSFGF